MLALSLLDSLSNTLITFQLATGKIRDYQIAVGGMFMMNFPVSYMLLKMGYAPEATMVAAIVISLCCLGLRLIFLKKMVQLSIGNYVKQVLANVFSVCMCAMILPLIVYHNLSDGAMRFVLTCLACIVSTTGIVLWIGCNRSERLFIYGKGADVYHKVIRN
jgi:branched-subunit amino acid transport protein